MTDWNADKKEFILYHCPQTRAGTTLWMNEELGAPCEVKLINVLAGEQKTPEFLAVNPMGKVPALVDEGHVVTEAAAICAHLADRFPDAGLAPLPGDPRAGDLFALDVFRPLLHRTDDARQTRQYTAYQ